MCEQGFANKHLYACNLPKIFSLLYVSPISLTMGIFELFSSGVCQHMNNYFSNELTTFLLCDSFPFGNSSHIFRL